MEPWRELHPLENAITKLHRAEKHLETFEVYGGKFTSLNPHAIAYKLNADKSLFEVRLIAEFPPFVDFGVVLGEFVYQLRSLLEHILFALAEFPSTLTPKELAKAQTSIQFPILEAEAKGFIEGRTRFVRPGLQVGVRKAIDAVQPYKRGDRYFVHPLWVLNELANFDKHRGFQSPIVKLRIETKDMPPGMRVLSIGTAGHGDVLAYVPSNLSVEEDFYPRVTADVLLPVVAPNGLSPYIGDLRTVYEYVRDHVLRPWLEFCPPLPSTVRF